MFRKEEKVFKNCRKNSPCTKIECLCLYKTVSCITRCRVQLSFSKSAVHVVDNRNIDQCSIYVSKSLSKECNEVHLYPRTFCW